MRGDNNNLLIAAVLCLLLLCGLSLSQEIEKVSLNYNFHPVAFNGLEKGSFCSEILYDYNFHTYHLSLYAQNLANENIHLVSEDLINWETFNTDRQIDGDKLRVFECDRSKLCFSLMTENSFITKHISFLSLSNFSDISGFRDPIIRNNAAHNNWTLLVAVNDNSFGRILKFACILETSVEQLLICTFHNTLRALNLIGNEMIGSPDLFKVGSPVNSLWVLKYSTNQQDYYELGDYYVLNGVFDSRTGSEAQLRFDYGPSQQTLSTTTAFYDPRSHEQIIFQWIDGIMSLPRKVHYNQEFHILNFLPADETVRLRETVVPYYSSFPERIRFDREQSYLSIWNAGEEDEDEQKENKKNDYRMQVYSTPIPSISSEIFVRFNVTMSIPVVGNAQEEKTSNALCLQNIEVGILGHVSSDHREYIKQGVGIRRKTMTADESYLYSVLEVVSSSSSSSSFSRQEEEDFPNYHQDYFHQIFTPIQSQSSLQKKMKKKLMNVMIEFQVFYDSSLIELYLRNGDFVSTLKQQPNDDNNMMISSDGFSIYVINHCEEDEIILEDLRAWKLVRPF